MNYDQATKTFEFTPDQSSLIPTTYTLRAKSELKPEEYYTDLTFVATGVDIFCGDKTWQAIPGLERGD